MTDFDVCIIGSGIGGSATGAILASKGLKTILFEKNEFIGGRCSTYEKRGFKVDVGVHSFARTSNGPLGQILKMIGMETAIEWVLARNPGPAWFYKDKFWKFPKELDKLLPPSETQNLVKLFKDITRIRDKHKFDNTSAKSWISKYSNNKIVHSFLNILCGLYFAIPYFEASAGELLRCLSSLTRHLSTGYPKGGCISIPQAYINAMKKLKGVIKTGVSVQKILVKDDKVQGVQLNNGETISSSVVISNAGIKETVNDLVGKKYFKKAFLKETDNLNYSMSAITLKLALEEPITHYKLITSISLEDPNDKFNLILEGKVPEEIDLFIPVPSNYDPKLAPKGKQLIIAGTMVPADSFEKNKEKWIQNSLSTLENIFPGLSEKLMWYEITTPEDIEVLGGKESSVIGISQSINQAGVNRPSITLPIEGLYMVGGDAGGWGIGTELAAKSAIKCSKLILDKLSLISGN